MIVSIKTMRAITTCCVILMLNFFLNILTFKSFQSLDIIRESNFMFWCFPIWSRYLKNTWYSYLLRHCSATEEIIRKQKRINILSNLITPSGPCKTYILIKGEKIKVIFYHKRRNYIDITRWMSSLPLGIEYSFAY